MRFAVSRFRPLTYAPMLAGEEGFEPPSPGGLPIFKIGGISHSPTLPYRFTGGDGRIRTCERQLSLLRRLSKTLASTTRPHLQVQWHGRSESNACLANLESAHLSNWNTAVCGGEPRSWPPCPGGHARFSKPEPAPADLTFHISQLDWYGRQDSNLQTLPFERSSSPAGNVRK